MAIDPIVARTLGRIAEDIGKKGGMPTLDDFPTCVRVAVLIVFLQNGCKQTEYAEFLKQEKESVFVFRIRTGEIRLPLSDILEVTKVARVDLSVLSRQFGDRTTTYGIRLHSGLSYGVGKRRTFDKLLEWVWTHYVAVHKKHIE